MIRRTPTTLPGKIQRMGEDDDLEEVLAMSGEQVDDELRASGLDPVKVGAKGVALVQRLVAQRKAAEQTRATVTRLRARAAGRPRPNLTRAELVTRIEAARNDPRLQQPVAVMFRDKTLERSTDDELVDLLEQIELLIEASRDPS